MIFCFSFLYLGMSHYGLLTNIFGGGLYCRGCFRTDYSIVLISEAAIAKCAFVFIAVAISFWWFFILLASSLLKSSFVDVFISFFCTYSTGMYFNDFFRCVFFITNCFISSRYFSLTVCIF